MKEGENLRPVYFSNTIKQIVRFLYSLLIKPRTKDEDSKRREFILNLILLGIICIMLWSNFFIFISTLRNNPEHNYISLVPFSLLTSLFIVLFIASRLGKIIFVSYCVVIIYFLGTMYGAFRWGITLPVIILSFALLIIMTSILINSKIGLMAAAISLIALTVFGYQEITHQIVPQWRLETITIFDLIEYGIILFVITLISWISTKEIEKSLHRARQSEKELRAERDSLEVTITERTKELELSQAEKMSQLYRFSEFGRLSSGIFHDIANPLTSLVLNLNNIQESAHPDVKIVKEDLNRAMKASHQMNTLIATITKQIKTEAPTINFSIYEAIEEVLSLFSNKTNLLKAQISITGDKTVNLQGNALKFHQIITNLISNAFDSYISSPQTQPIILITINISHNDAIITITDHGQGISEDIIEKIFDPFFSTKPSSQGMGLGLAMVKSIVIKEFNGDIQVTSNSISGTNFTLTFSLTQNDNLPTT
jgi:signal transduction histidine kinase